VETVEIENKGNTIIIEPKNTLSEIIESCVNEDNIHEEIEAHGPVGKEVW
jgi:antitoxin component of MazEF toxin-antitoxin module